MSSVLVQKAQDLLHNNGDQIALDVLRVHSLLPTTGDLSETDPESCASQEYEDVHSLAEKSAVYIRDRLPVIFFSSERVLDSLGNVRPAISRGCGYVTAPGRAYAMINIRALAPDHVTLLHEIGHGAGLSHESDVANFMSYGMNRSTVNPIQLTKLAAAYFTA